MCTNSKKVSNFNPNLANDKSIFSIYSTLFELYIDKQEPCGRNKGINMLGRAIHILHYTIILGIEPHADVQHHLNALIVCADKKSSL